VSWWSAKSGQGQSRRIDDLTNLCLAALLPDFSPIPEKNCADNSTNSNQAKTAWLRNSFHGNIVNGILNTCAIDLRSKT
jgi:hypothetical protein